jgi:hypothetical protein
LLNTILTVLSLRKKMQRARDGVETTSAVPDQLTATLPKESVETWKVAAANASVSRGESLRIYDINLGQGADD